MRLTRSRILFMLVLLGATGLTGLGFALRHVPDFYKRSAVAPGPERCELSNDFFVKEFVSFVTAFTDGKGPWSFTFTQEQLNSFFEEDFVRFGDADHFRKVGIRDPRLEFNDQQLRFGFRYGGEKWNTVLSYDLKMWVAKNDVNVIAVEIQRRRAGAMPIPSQQILSEMTELGRRHNIDISWFRHEGNPVAIVKFQSDRPRPTAQLRELTISPGALTIRGFSFDPVQNPLEEPAPTTPVQVSREK